MIRKTAYCGLLVATAFLLSYIESIIPIPIGIPGVKLGIANLAVFAALYITDVKSAYIILTVRLILVAVTFGNLFSLIFSAAGGFLSLTLMVLCRKKNIFGKVGVSIVGGVSHNIAQTAVAVCVLRTPELFWYLPTLLVAGAFAGAVIGMLGGLLLERFLTNSGYLF